MTKSGVSRRQLLAGTAGVAGGLTALGTLPTKVFAGEKVVKIGFLAPLTGEAAGWGLPGLYGVEIWIERVNAAGGMKVGNDTYKVEVVPYDDENDTPKTLVGAKKLVFEDDVKFMIMMGGAQVQAAQDFMTRNEMLTTTLAPSDMTSDTPYLLAPVETHPIYNVTGVDWVARNWPDAKTVAIATQEDEVGLASLATYRAAFEVAGIDIIYEKLFGFDTVDFAPIVSPMVAAQPDLICWDTAYPDYVNLLTEQAYLQGYKGRFVSCTLDQYDQIMAKTSKDFIEGFVFQFPDFDDPMLEAPDINFEDPADFYRVYNERYPGAWNAVSWEYPAITEMWKDAVQMAGSVEPMAVLKAWKSMSPVRHVFGPAVWWGDEMFGVDNAPIGKWPVVQIQQGKAVIVEMGDVKAWLDKNVDVLIRHYKDLELI